MYTCVLPGTCTSLGRAIWLMCSPFIYTYINIYKFIFICICICICKYVRTHSNIHTYILRGTLTSLGRVSRFMWSPYVYIYVQTYSYTYVFIYLYIYLSIFIYRCIDIYCAAPARPSGEWAGWCEAPMYIYMYRHIHISMYLSTYISIYLYLYTDVWVYIARHLHVPRQSELVNVKSGRVHPNHSLDYLRIAWQEWCQ